MDEIFSRDSFITRRVLVVDDEEINREILGNIINNEYEVLYAADGVEAMKIVHDNEETLSLIMLDLLMPKKDGYDVLRDLQRSDSTKRIPVIVLTSEKSAEVKSIDMGAVDFIPKPYDMPEVIRARVRRSIQLAESYAMLNKTELDSLTKLYNQDFFFEYCEQYDRFFPNKAMDAVAININRFHVVNELNGRDYGDKVLQATGKSISHVTTLYRGFACRSGDDMFLLYMPHYDDYTQIFNDFEKAFQKMVNNPRISLRIGVYENDDPKIDMKHRFDRAKVACNKLRNNYKTTFVIYDNQLREKELYNETLLQEMDTALKEKQFFVCFQPKYNIKGDVPILASAEALIRWKHPEFGVISPGQFIPLFEENGLIHKLDHFVWDETAAHIRMWKDKYGTAVPVSANVSRMDIYDPNLENELLGIIKAHNLTTADLLLEVTESAYTDNSSQIVKTVERLRADGFRVEMDDFGSGYSSLNMLAELPIDALKLDMRFVKNICTSEKDLRMVNLMIDIARYLKVSVISEGVETKEQYLLLKQAGCDIIQGYYFSKPIVGEEFEKLIVAKEWKC